MSHSVRVRGQLGPFVTGVGTIALSGPKVPCADTEVATALPLHRTRGAHPCPSPVTSSRRSVSASSAAASSAGSRSRPRTGPHIIPVNYAVFEDTIVVRTSSYSLLGTYGRNAMLAFEVDHIDHDRHVGWSVVARGRGWAEVDPAQVARIRDGVAAAPVGRRHPQPLPPHPVGVASPAARSGTDWTREQRVSRTSHALRPAD